MGKNFFGVEFAPLRIPIHRRLQTFAVLHYIFIFLLFPVFSILGPIYLILFTQFWWLMILYAAWFVYDYNTPKKGSRPKKWFRRFWLWRHFRDYFPISLKKSADLDPNRNYIFGYHPHGLVSVGAFTNFGTEATNFSDVFPGLKPAICTLVGQFWFPFRREYSMLCGAIEVSKESIAYQLSQKGKGNAVVIVIGGAAEALDARPGCFDITLSKRKGFVKIAIQHGADLVPVFSFGENDLFLQVGTRGSFIRRLQLAMKKFLGYSPALFHGRGVFNYTFGIMPYRKPIMTVVGKPVQVEQCAHPTREQVEATHEKYVAALNEIFEENKRQFGISDDIHLNIH